MRDAPTLAVQVPHADFEMEGSSRIALLVNHLGHDGILIWRGVVALLWHQDGHHKGLWMHALHKVPHLLANFWNGYKLIRRPLIDQSLAMFLTLCFDGGAASAKVFTHACFWGAGFFILAPLTFHTSICDVSGVLSMANRPPSMARRHGPCFAPPDRPGARLSILLGIYEPCA